MSGSLANKVVTKDAALGDISVNLFTDATDMQVVTIEVDLSDGSSRPAWLSYNGPAKKISGTPTEEGQWYVRVFAYTDNYYCGSKEVFFWITVICDWSTGSTKHSS